MARQKNVNDRILACKINMAQAFYLLFFAAAPGIIWLLYFLKKDVHPESKRMILKIFFYGMISAIPAALIEKGIQAILPKNIFLNNIFQYYIFLFLSIIVGVALVEETIKYLVVRIEVLSNSELDEPVDVMLYMIIAALGFATLENIFIFLSPDIFLYTFRETLTLASFRFISATFLHALASGTIGFFLALSFYKIKRKRMLVFSGFAAAVLLHGLYNFSIMELGGASQYGVPLLVLTGLAVFIYFGIKKLKKLKSICKIN